VTGGGTGPLDALVLGGGGILGEAWMLGVLAGLEEATGFDPRTAEAFVGTSAGSIVAAVLAGGVAPRERLGDFPTAPPADEPPAPARLATLAEGVLGLGRGAVAAAAPLALRASVPGGALVRRLALGRVPRGRRSLRGLGAAIERGGARWDGRLRIAALDLESGRRVMFGAPDAPAASVGAAVEASCAIPGVFAPIEIGGRDFVDGGAWSPTNMDALSVERGAEVLVLNPTGSLRGGRASALRAYAQLSQSIARLEALALERRGARVRIVAPDAGSIAAIGPNLMDARPRERVASAAYAQGLALRLS
jgi:NTE family protein